MSKMPRPSKHLLETLAKADLVLLPIHQGLPKEKWAREIKPQDALATFDQIATTLEQIILEFDTDPDAFAEVGLSLRWAYLDLLRMSSEYFGGVGEFSQYRDRVVVGLEKLAGIRSINE